MSESLIYYQGQNSSTPSVGGLVPSFHPSWEPYLVPALDQHWDSIAAILEGKDYLPAAENVFRAFEMPLDEVKVLIVGQDPYPTPGHAMGLAFSTQPGVKAPRSLINIYAELESDLGITVGQTATEQQGNELAVGTQDALFGATPTAESLTQKSRPGIIDGDLTPWTQQGVLLLNRVLTVAPGNAGSHRRIGWEAITEAAIRALNKKPMVAVLWGKDAQGCAQFIPDVPTVMSPHPSPLSARRGFLGSQPFSTVNAYLRDQDCQEIDWRL